MRQIHRLNQILRVWEDACYMAKMGGQAQVALGVPPKLPLRGCVQHFEQLRGHLLEATQKRFDFERFLPPPAPPANPKAQEQVFGILTLLPAMLFCWNAYSRRVFRIEEDLQILLDATSLDRMRWQDVVMPFDSFAITLERPIEGSKGDKYDCILVSVYKAEKKDETSVIEVRLLSTVLDEYTPISGQTRKSIERAVHFKEWDKVLEKVNAAYKQYQQCEGKRGSVFLLDMVHGEALVTDSVTALVKKSGFRVIHSLDDPKLVPEWDAAVRIVVGMCLYLQTLPPGKSHASDWEPTEVSNPDSRCITNGALVCTVSSSYKLKREEREALGLDRETPGERLSAYEVRAHFRMGHWRRAPGTGDDPKAPRIVHVRPTIVRRDRVGEAQLPGGAETVL